MRVGITYRFEEKLVPYAQALRYVGLEVAPLYPGSGLSLEGLQGLVISGGTDLNPKLYGQELHPLAEEADDARDAMELALLQQALDRDMPVLAICRGLQLFNVAHGGDLLQHLPNTEDHRQRGVMDVHDVETESGTHLAAITGGRRFAVNSRHHQSVQRIGAGLVVSAQSPDGVIEGLERPDRRFAVAVQWHPEDRVPQREPDTQLFRAFAQVLPA